MKSREYRIDRKTAPLRLWSSGAWVKTAGVMLTTIVLAAQNVYGSAPRIGTTYSRYQSEYFGMEWEDVYREILDMGFEVVRLGAYWDRIEEKEGIYDFSGLDWQIKEARKKGVSVILTVGMKAPRWPEFFIPGWVLEKGRPRFGADVSETPYLKERTLAFVRKTVERYRNERAIICWQVENEPANHIGKEYWYVGMALVEEEIAVVREVDDLRRPVMVTAATYPNRLLRTAARLVTSGKAPIKRYAEAADIVGINVYPAIGQKLWGHDVCFRSDPGDSAGYFGSVIDLVRSYGKKVWVTELQAEPWEPGHLVYKDEEAPVTCSPGNTAAMLDMFERMGVGTILLWGAEYWCYRDEVYGDDSWLRMVSGFAGTDSR